MKIRKLIGKLILLLMTVCLLTGFTIVSKGYRLYQQALEDQSLSERVEAVRGKEGYTLFEDLPEVYANAVISVEDHRFYEHKGIDGIAILRAMVNDLKAGSFVEGGSTIPQQLAKNLCFTQEKKLERKVAEIFMAFDLEDDYTKDEIFELYVNSIYFGDGYYSISEAARGYFNKQPQDMTEYESTLLAGIPNAPSVYAPTKNPELAGQRQLQVLKRLEECGYFSQEEAETVAAQTMVLYQP